MRFKINKTTAQLLIAVLLTVIIFTQAVSSSLATRLPTGFFEEYGSPMLIIEPKTGQILLANKAATNFYGYTASQLTSKSMQDINALDKKDVEKEMEQAKSTNRNYFIFPHRLASGEIRTVEVYSWPLVGDNGEDLLFSIILDLTGRNYFTETSLEEYKNRLEVLAETRYQQLVASEKQFNWLLALASLVQLIIITFLIFNIINRRQAQAQLAEKNLHLEGLLNSLPEMVFFKNLQLKYLGCNQVFASAFNKQVEEIIGLTDIEFIQEKAAKIIANEDKKVLETQQVHRVESWITFPNGQKQLIEKLKAPLFNAQGKLEGVVGIARDITSQHQQQQKIKYLAYYDPLTHLPNKYLFQENLAAISRKLNPSKAVIALAIIDLDHFKNINDALGHNLGDEILVKLAKRLQRLLASNEILARFGGDEFVLLLIAEGDDQPSLINALKNRLDTLQLALAEPLKLGQQELIINSSLGVSFDTKFNKSFADLLKEADIALYAAKAAGRATWRSFVPSMQNQAERRFALEGKLRKAITNNELALYLQPKTGQNGLVYGVEALVRWLHPEQGLVSPAEFIPLAEETGLIVPLGEWVLEQTLKLMPSYPNLNFAVNVSPRQFHNLGFVEFVEKQIEATQANPLNLTLEVTEGLLITDFEKSANQMQKLQKLGINFSIDDFGTGYSSLSYLKRLPINELKIDRSFIDGLPEDSNDVLLVETMMSIAQHLQLSVVAEGVETQAQQEFLYSIGCLLHQGFYYGKPEPAEQLLASLDLPVAERVDE